MKMKSTILVVKLTVYQQLFLLRGCFAGDWLAGLTSRFETQHLGTAGRQVKLEPTQVVGSIEAVMLGQMLDTLVDV